MSIVRRFPQSDKLSYDPVSDTVVLLGGFAGTAPVVGVRKAELSSGAALLSEIQAFEEVVINPGCIVRGGVSSPRVLISTGGTTPTIILGDLFGPSFQERAASVLKVHGDGEALIQGTIVSDRVEIAGKVTVIGDIFALQELSIEGPALVLGRAMVGSEKAPGHASLSRATIYQLFSVGDAVLGDGVTLISPIAVAKSGRILWRDLSTGEERLFSEAEAALVRVFSFPCLFCPKVRNPLLCEKFLDGECDAFESLRSYDYSLVRDLDVSVLSWMWRASPAIVAQNLLAKRILAVLRSLYNPPVDLGSRSIGGVPFTEYPSRVVQEALAKFREAAGEYSEVVRKTLIDLLEDFYRRTGKEYTRCPKCGVPKPVDAKVCIYCGEASGGSTA